MKQTYVFILWVVMIVVVFIVINKKQKDDDIKKIWTEQNFAR